MKKDISYKVFFRNYGIVVAFLVILFGLLIYISKVSQKSWRNNLRTTTQTVLDEYNPDKWIVGNNIRIKNAFSQSAALYEVRNKKNGESYKTIIIRNQTLFGPIPAVFVIDNNGTVTFIGYSSVHGKIQNQLTNYNFNKRLSYWTDKIPEIIK